LCDVSSDFLYKDLFGGPFFMPFLKERRDSDGRKKAKAYGIEEAGRQSREKKIEYEGAGAG
jgi:hypothetical protein